MKTNETQILVNGSEFPLDLLKKYLINFRSSKNAKILFSRLLENYILNVSKRAFELAKNSSRKTILEKDVAFIIELNDRKE